MSARAKRASVRRSIAALLAACALAAAWTFGFANLAVGSRRTIDTRLEDAIARGLDYLDRLDEFRAFERSPVEYWIALDMLQYTSHAGFRGDVEAGWQYLVREGAHFANPPDGPPAELSPELLAQLADIVRAGTPGSPHLSAYFMWYLWASYPEALEMHPLDRAFFDGDWRASWFGYPLTHRWFGYRVLEQDHPAYSAKHGVAAARRRTAQWMLWENRLHFAVSDLWVERVAFLLADPDVDGMNERWIERLLLDQNPDGGWAFHASTACAVSRLLGMDCTRGPSEGHTSFLAVYALLQYRAAASP